MARPIVLLLLCPLLIHEAWGQYSTKAQYITRDITAYLPTVNGWKPIPQGGICQPGTLSMGIDGAYWCKGTDNYLYYLQSPKSTQWTKNTPMGTAMTTVSAADLYNVFGLAPTSACSTGGTGMGLFQWNNITANWDAKTGCLSQLRFAPQDGAVIGVNKNDQLWESLDFAITWKSLGSGFTFADGLSATQICAVSTVGRIYTLQNGAMTAIAAPPQTHYSRLLKFADSLVL